MAVQDNPQRDILADNPPREPQPPGPAPGQSSEAVVVLFMDISLPQGAPPEASGPLQERALAIMAEFGGRSSGTAANSVRAYFTNSKEALKAAVKIQQAALAASQEGTAGPVPEARIGIHFAESLSQSNSIADVVGMATRLARGAAVSQIYVSEPVRETTSDLHGVHFEAVSVLEKAVVWDGPPVYQVNWERNIDYKPGTCIVLFFNPLWAAGDSSFPALWAAVVREDGKTWGATVAKKQVLGGNALGVVLDDVRSAPQVAQNVLGFVWDRMEKDTEKPILPVLAFIHVLDRAGEGIPTIKESDFPTAGVEPGQVYVSAEALKFIRNQTEIPIVSGKDASTLSSWHKVGVDLGQDGPEVVDFAYQEVLAAGREESCFYCGSRRHKPGECPSKHLPENTRGLEGLGYFSVKEINRLFKKFLTVEKEDPHRFQREVLDGHSAHLGPAFEAFYDLNKVIQLRFFRSLFFAPGNEWGKKTDSSGQAKGGQQWLALDSLRVNELVRAESMLKEALAKHPEDYRIYCTLAYVYAERGDLAEAEYQLKKAIKYTKVNTSKIFVHFLLSHLNKLLNRTETAHRNIGDILALDPGCPEALYEDALFRFREGDEKGGIQRLSILILDDNRYYVQALIDPNMAPHKAVVAGHLRGVLEKAREAAETLVASVDEELRKSTAVLQEKDLQEVRSLRSEIQTLLTSRSYFGYLDVPKLAETIIKICKEAVQEQKKEAQRLLDNLGRQAEKDMAFVLDYSFPRLINSYYAQLEQIRDKIIRAKQAPPPASPEELDACVLVREEIKADLARIEKEFSKLEGWRQILLNGFKFVKFFLIFLSAALFLGVVVLPMALRQLSPILFGTVVPPGETVSALQGWFVVVGGAASLVAAFLVTTKSLFHKVKQSPAQGLLELRDAKKGVVAKKGKSAKPAPKGKGKKQTKQAKPKK